VAIAAFGIRVSKPRNANDSRPGTRPDAFLGPAEHDFATELQLVRFAAIADTMFLTEVELSELHDAQRKIQGLERELADAEAQLRDRRVTRHSADPRLNRLLGDPVVLATFPHLILVLSRDLRILYVNRAEEGQNPADFIGADCLISIHPDFRERYRSVFEESWHSGEPASIELRSINEVWWDSRLVPIRDAGEIVFMLVSSTDVTQRKAQEQALRERESSARLSLLASGVGTWTWWLRSNDLYWDEALCGIFGVEPKNAPRSREEYLELVHSEDRAEVIETIARYVETGVYDGMAYRIVRPDGAVRHVIAKGVAQFDEHGQLEALRGGVLDVTERKELEASLAQAQRIQAVGRLTAGIAHNLNNSLSVILPNVAECRELATGPVAERLADIEHASTRAAEMVRQLMLFARPQDATRSAFDLTEAARRIVDMCRSTFDRKMQIELVPAQIPHVLGNSGQIEQVLLNVCLNARDALVESDRGQPCLRVEFSAAVAGRVCVSIADNGVGMTEAVRARMFEPFFTTKEVGRGTGLGLSSAYAIVIDHGGTIQCSSRLGEGTRFEIELPAAPTAKPARATPQLRPVPVGTETILMVDDESAVRRALRGMLERSGFRIIECEDGSQALAALERGERVDAVLIDRSMPGLSGEQVIERIWQLGIRLPILVLSGHSSVELRNPNVRAVLSKPITREALVSEVRRALDERAPLVH
jgi:two-component system, cell cycle sensor histidine kinase and response regulator CckA